MKTVPQQHIIFNSGIKRRSQGFTNRTALIAIAVGYPLGVIWLSILANTIQSTSSIRNVLPEVSLQPSISSTPSEKEAVQLVRRWLEAKPQLFGQSYDLSAARDLVVSDGPLWADLVKSDGPIGWLRNNGSYYIFDFSRVDGVVNYDTTSNPNRPIILVKIAESLSLHGPNGNAPTSSVRNFKYILSKEGGRWKIWDYQ